MIGNEDAHGGQGDSSAHVPVDLDPPTQVAYPGRASWRTFFQTLVAFLPTANGILLALQSLLAQPPYDQAIPGWVFLAVNAAVVFGAFTSKAVAYLMANPLVDKWLQDNAPSASARPRNE